MLSTIRPFNAPATAKVAAIDRSMRSCAPGRAIDGNSDVTGLI